MKVNKNHLAGSGVWMSLCLAVLCSLATGQDAAAQTNTAPARVTNRYLLIVETSRSMQERADGALRLAAELFTTGMGGQVQRGDTIGLWTFNDELHAGNFPLQNWSPATRTNIAKNVVNFLRSQKFEKKPRFNKVMPALQQVIHNSDYITVIVISSGEAPVKGTQFDARVNEFYKAWSAQQKASRMPFIAILRGQKGQFADCTMHWAPWPIDMPALPQELIAARAAAKPPTLAARPNPPGLPPITFTGHKPSEPVSPPRPQNTTPSATPTTATLQPRTDNPATSTSAPGSSPIVLAFQGQSASGTIPAEKPSSVSASSNDGSLLKPQPSVAAAPQAKPSVESASTNSSVSPQASSNPPGVTKIVESPAASAPAVEKPANSAVAAASPVDILPGTAFVNGNLIWVAAGLCLVLAALIFWRLREHARQSLHVSLITRSLEQKQD